uniref:(northern house mosquito) hypothetical protein n=1 Tax=Culex pipiens TaxID=7175 RepID=A0A8D8CPB3_CULPI
MMTPLVAIATFAVVISSQCLASPAGQDRSTQPSFSRRPVPTQAPSPYKDGQRVPAGNADLFAFPADPSTIESKTNARNRTPVFIPDRCQENEILYPGDQESDWVCDCKPSKCVESGRDRLVLVSVRFMINGQESRNRKFALIN